MQPIELLLTYGLGLLLAVPFGIAADCIGRRPFLLLGLCSFPLRYAWIQFICESGIRVFHVYHKLTLHLIAWFWQGFNLHTIWVSSLHGIMGGSGPVATALVFVIVSDVTTEADRFARTTAELQTVLC